MCLTVVCDDDSKYYKNRSTISPNQIILSARKLNGGACGHAGWRRYSRDMSVACRSHSRQSANLLREPQVRVVDVFYSRPSANSGEASHANDGNLRRAYLTNEPSIQVEMAAKTAEGSKSCNPGSPLRVQSNPPAQQNVGRRVTCGLVEGWIGLSRVVAASRKPADLAQQAYAYRRASAHGQVCATIPS